MSRPSDYKPKEPNRLPWNYDTGFTETQTRNPRWNWGDGAAQIPSEQQHIQIDPQDDTRTAADNYKLLISAIIPRPIGFVSTLSQDGVHANLAPISYFQLVNHDPPIFVLGFAGGTERMKDTLKNLLASKECVINIISEHFLEAANAAAVNAPYGVSEWPLTGLTPARCDKVKASRVMESIFSVEAMLNNVMEFESRKHIGRKAGAMAVVEGVQFWIREDALRPDNTLDPSVLRPVSRLGGSSYGRTTTSIDLPRPEWMPHLTDVDMKRLR